MTPFGYRFALRAFGCFLLGFCLTSVASAKGHKHNGGPASPGNPAGNTGAFDWAPPEDWPAARQINAYVGAYLQSCILAPLDAPVPPPRAALGTMSVDFTAHLAAAETPAERALYTSAVNACDLLARVLDERDAEQINLVGNNAGNNAVNPLDRPAYAVSGHYGWNLEWERTRSQRRQEAQAQLANLDRKNSVVMFALKHWADQLPGFRQSIQTAATNVTTAQIRFDRELAAHPQGAPAPANAVAAHPAAKPAPDAASADQDEADDADNAPAAPAPAAPAPKVASSIPPAVAGVPGNPAPPTPGAAGSPAGTDPAVGDWLTKNGGPITLGNDHVIRNGRDGTWVYTGTNDKGRNYELHWNHKDWVDWVVLSDNGKVLYGANKKEAIWYSRR